MSLPTGLVLTIETASAVPEPPSYPIIRSLLDRTPEAAAGEGGSLRFTYRMTDAEIRAASAAVSGPDYAPTPDGLASCLSALAREAREIGLGQASWAIELAVQLIAMK